MYRRLWILLLAVGCAAAPRPPPAPAWFHKVPESRESLYFAGSASAAPSPERARELAYQKAMSALVTFVGARVRSDFTSFEREKNGVHEQSVDLVVEVAGEALTLRGVRLKDSSTLESGAGWDGYALIEWPKKEREAVMAAAQARALRALELFRQAEQAERSGDLVQATAGLKNALDLLGASRAPLPLADPELSTTETLRAAAQSLLDRLEAERVARRGRCALGLRCLRDGAPSPCRTEHQAAFEGSITGAGVALVPGPVGAETLTAILEGGGQGLRPGLPVGCVVAVELSSETLGKVGPFFYARGSGRLAILDVESGQIRRTAQAKPDKVGHISEDQAAEKGYQQAEKALAPELARALR